MRWWLRLRVSVWYSFWEINIRTWRENFHITNWFWREYREFEQNALAIQFWQKHRELMPCLWKIFKARCFYVKLTRKKNPHERLNEFDRLSARKIYWFSTLNRYENQLLNTLTIRYKMICESNHRMKRKMNIKIKTKKWCCICICLDIIQF